MFDAALRRLCLVVCCFLACACGVSERSAGYESASSPVSSPAPSSSVQQFDSGATGARPSYAPDLPDDESSRRAAERVAVEALSAFCVGDVHGQAAWLDGLRRWFTPAGVEFYESVDAANVTRCRVGDAAISFSSPGVARVAVGTDVGQYTVILRRGSDAQWRAERLEFPNVGAR